MISEKIIITYTDTLITTMNPRTNPQSNEIPHPHPCSVDYNSIPKNQKDNHYESIINCCQRHICKPEGGYCKKNPTDPCRFGFPKELNLKSRIEFTNTSTSVKANIILKRNDPYMNNHIRIKSENWLANIDIQIILDQAAAISYMVKYATKAEKAGSSLHELYKSVILNVDENDNPVKKLRSLMLKTVNGKRDLGQCEVCRLLMSESLFSSTFEYITQSLELNQFKEVNRLNNNNDNKLATNPSLIDFYANRKNIPVLKTELNSITSFFKFVQTYNVKKGQLHKRNDFKKVIAVFYPKVRANKKIPENYIDFCYYQLIKLSEWNIDDIAVLKNKNTAIQRFEQFVKAASQEQLESIKLLHIKLIFIYKNFTLSILNLP